MERQLEQARAEVKKERERAAALLLENEELRRQLAEKGITPKLPPAIERGAEEARRLAAVRELASAQTRLAETQTALTEMKGRVAELEASMERAAAENRRLEAVEAALREEIENTRRVAQAMEAEIRAKNERLAQIINNLREQIQRFRTTSLSLPGRMQAALEEHKKIVDAISTRDGALARRLAEEHIENAENSLMEAIRAADRGEL
ncbi:MAG: FCD domain-containing protein [Firmicutes bacterium]|nr:FCD domain-containing protein [Bacillota bacterium]